MAQNEQTRKAVIRLEIVAAYLSMDYAVTMFAALFNARDICSHLRDQYGPVEAEDLDRWADICMGVAE